jgi:hypothetical protein
MMGGCMYYEETQEYYDLTVLSAVGLIIGFIFGP